MTFSLTCDRAGNHANDDLTGYRVRQTYQDGELLALFPIVQEFFAPGEFGAAIHCARERRSTCDAGDGRLTSIVDWFTVHPMYRCGCEGLAY